MTAQRVASVEDEARLLPAGMSAEASEDGYEPVFMVTVAEDGTETIEGGSVIDTWENRYFTFNVVVAEDGSPDALPTSDWLPLPEEDEA